MHFELFGTTLSSFKSSLVRCTCVLNLLFQEFLGSCGMIEEFVVDIGSGPGRGSHPRILCSSGVP